MQSAEEIAERISKIPTEKCDANAAIEAFRPVLEKLRDPNFFSRDAALKRLREAKNREAAAKSQHSMAAMFRLILPTTFFKKSGIMQARKGKPGEYVETIIDGELETTRTVGENEVVIRGPAGEDYVVSITKFHMRYNVDKELTDDFQGYEATGIIRAFEYVGQPFIFIASWGEEMLCKPGDFLATPAASTEDMNVHEIYRIERGVFDTTYTPIV